MHFLTKKATSYKTNHVVLTIKHANVNLCSI